MKHDGNLQQDKGARNRPENDIYGFIDIIHTFTHGHRLTYHKIAYLQHFAAGHSAPWDYQGFVPIRFRHFTV
jgi:hypothetical protein